MTLKERASCINTIELLKRMAFNVHGVMDAVDIENCDKIIKMLNDDNPHWIPCSERMPKEKDAGILKKLGTKKRSEYVLATVEAKGERMTVTACTYDGKWDWNMKYAYPDFKVVAWMPLPEPYRGEDK